MSDTIFPGRLRRLRATAAGWVLNNGRGDGPPDLDELWRDFNRKLSGLFGGKGGGGAPKGNGPGDGGGSNFQPDMKSAGIGASLIAGVIVMIWLGSGFFIVQAGQQAVVTSFGKYTKTVDAGFQWRMPYPFQADEIVNVTQLRTAEVGRNNVNSTTGLRDSSMLTQDENIVDIPFTVQYRIRNAREFLYENQNPEAAVTLAAESAVREIVGKSKVDSVFYEQRAAISSELVKSIQDQLDRLKAGITVVNVNVQNVAAPQQVQEAFDDTLKASQDGDRLKKEAQAYASTVIPQAKGAASRLHEEAEGYKARVVAEAEGNAQRFSSVLAEYQKAPAVTRDRMYLDTMQQVYGNVSKIVVDSRNNANLINLPLDKLMQQSAAATVPTAVPASPPVDTAMSGASGDARSRDNQRGRDRDTR